jgi:hypothetical protein
MINLLRLILAILASLVRLRRNCVGKIWSYGNGSVCFAGGCQSGIRPTGMTIRVAMPAGECFVLLR